MINWLKNYCKPYCTYKVTDNDLVFYQTAIMVLTLAIVLVFIGVGWWYIEVIHGGAIALDKDFTWGTLLGVAGVIGVIGLVLFTLAYWKFYKTREVIK